MVGVGRCRLRHRPIRFFWENDVYPSTILRYANSVYGLVPEDALPITDS